MAARQRDVMFVGSVPLRPAAKVFEAIARYVGPLAPRIPDGEQAGWLTLARESFSRNPVLEACGQVALEPSSNRRVTMYRVKSGYTAKDLKLGPYGYGRNAIESYRQFKELKERGKIPQTTRFQFTIPGPGTSSYVVQLPAEELLPLARQAIADEIEEVLTVVPARELAGQIDLGMEAEHEEYLRRPSAWNQPVHEIFHWTQEQMAESAAWVANRIPAEVQLGFHICSIWHHDPAGGQDNEVLVDTANAVLAKLTRAVSYVHIPVIPEHQERDYQAFKRVALPEGARLFLGLLNLADGIEGARKRIAMAEKVLSDFGIAMFCGLGHAPDGRMGMYHDRGIPALRRATPATIGDVLELHRQAAHL